MARTMHPPLDMNTTHTATVRAISMLETLIAMMRDARRTAPLSQYGRIDEEIAGMEARVAELRGR